MFSLICVNAEIEYPSFGGYAEDYYSNDYSFFNQFVDDSIEDVFPFTDVQFMPLVADLDGDETNEIIILADGVIAVLHAIVLPEGILFEIIDAYTTNATLAGSYWSNMLTYDIDGDSKREIIVHSQQVGHIYIMDFNGSTLVDQGYNWDTYWNVGTPPYSADSMIGCGDDDGCVIIYNDRNRFDTGTTRYLYANVFNTTKVVTTTQKTIHSNVDQPYCLPKFKDLAYGNDKYYFTWGFYPGNPYLTGLEVNSTRGIIFTNQYQSYNVMDFGNNCGRGVTQLTSPVVIDYTIDTGMEIGYGTQASLSDFKMVIYKSNYDLIDEYPETFASPGQIISNPFVANSFIDSEHTSLCVVGYQKSYGAYGRLTILCADFQSEYSGVQNNVVFYHNFLSERDYNITATNIYSVGAHSINSIQSNQLSEVLNPYGVFELENRANASLFSLCYLSQDCDAYIRYEMPIQEEIAVISVDYFNNGYEDLIALSNTNLYYIDDGFINKNAYLGYCTKIQPAIDTIWQIHEQWTEQVIIADNFTHDEADSFIMTTGKDVINSYVQTWSFDAVRHSIKENARRLNITYTINNPCDGYINKIAINSWWDSDDVAEVVTLRVFNDNLNVWEALKIIPDSASSVWQNISLPTNYSQYIQSGNMRLQFVDAYGTDGADSYLYIDYISLICDGTETIISSPSNKTNEVRVRVKPIDPENNKVSARVVLYQGETNVQDSGWSEDYSSGTQIPFNGFRPNETTLGSTLRIYYRDSTNYENEPLYEDFNFVVQGEGDTTLDSFTCEGITEEEYESGEIPCDEDSDCDGGACIENICTDIPDTCDSSADCPEGFACVDGDCKELPTEENNAVTDVIGELSYFSGVPMLVLFLLAILGVSIYVISTDIPPQAKAPIIIILSFFMIGAGVALDLIGIVWLIMYIIVGVAVGAIYVGRHIKGD
jgi:hypothetical protein